MRGEIKAKIIEEEKYFKCKMCGCEYGYILVDTNKEYYVVCRSCRITIRKFVN